MLDDISTEGPIHINLCNIILLILMAKVDYSSPLSNFFKLTLKIVF